MPTLQDELTGTSEASQDDDLIDRGAVLERVDNDQELLKEIIELFLDDCPRLMEDIRAAVHARDAFALRHAAHTLKGSVGNFAAQTAFETARVLEFMGTDNDFAGATEALARLDQIISRLCPALTNLVPTPVWKGRPAS
jgi:two-component system sensor histidine kinase/response regulator